ncbi:MAG TPA: hypothetical protein VGN07_22865 [Steroidobacteraceae bacterium]|jgi:hypothetical protein
MRTLIIALIACGATGAVHAAEAERNPLESKVIVEAGWFLMATDMRVRVDGETTASTGSNVDFDDTFGIGDFDRFRAEMSWRIAPRHLVRAMYFQNNRTASRALDRDVEFGGETYPVGVTVDARSKLTVAQLSYEYAFLKRDNYELAGGIGVHYIDMALGLNATVAGQGGSASRNLDQEATTQAPLPVLGLRGLWRLPHDFYASAQVQYFYIELDPYKGSLIDLKASLVWQFSDHVGVGVAYNDFGFRFDIQDRGNFDGRLRWDYGGAIAFVNFMF